ncbi:Aromatic/aminoadipate aminotransferase 1 [Fusarium torreyae]|uniref:aromatic-amino-acid transaminase n=1 Tax=Fusarium torreyae TaxID=1237075 RepID=A0A9W8S3N8_9HYPO|nr:Aromatic/aminoadipate aminotransferase 1 [Fusarium torreyae]
MPTSISPKMPSLYTSGLDQAGLNKDEFLSRLNAIKERRAAAGTLKAGPAAASSSDMFKGPTSNLPAAKTWHHHLTDESLRRGPCSLKQAARYMKPGMVSLGGGFPSSQYFPVTEIMVRIPSAPSYSDAEAIRSGQVLSIGKHDCAQADDAEYDLNAAFQYCQSTGSAQLLRFITEHTELMHNPPYADWQCCQTIGSTSALELALRMLCCKERRDSVLTEEYSFATALETLRPLSINVFGVSVDDEGLVPEAMDSILSDWDETARGARRPHVLYTVPSGQNPTGATQSTHRRRALYAVAQKHDIYIIEDDPYYFLQMPPYSNKEADNSQSSPVELATSLMPSILSMDTDGRVLRMDSLSKVLFPAVRLGWVTGSAQMIERFVRHAEVAVQAPAGLSQAVVWKLLDQTWGHEGFLSWLSHIRSEYTMRRNWIIAACCAHLPSDLVTWTPPSAGMFLWLKIDHSRHPDSDKRSIAEVEEEIFSACIGSGVLCARGSWFKTETETPLDQLYLRVTFASASQEEMEKGIQRLGSAIKSSFRVNSQSVE